MRAQARAYRVPTATHTHINKYTRIYSYIRIYIYIYIHAYRHNNASTGAPITSQRLQKLFRLGFLSRRDEFSSRAPHSVQIKFGVPIVQGGCGHQIRTLAPCWSTGSWRMWYDALICAMTYSCVTWLIYRHQIWALAPCWSTDSCHRGQNSLMWHDSGMWHDSCVWHD